MALPHGEWLDVKSGPGTWEIIKSLFREDDETERREFTVFDPDGSRKHTFEVAIREVRRLGRKVYMIVGFVQQLEGHTGDHFIVHYNPETRKGSLKFLL